MKKLVLSLMAVASLFASKALADNTYGDPTSESYMVWEYQEEPQALNMTFPNATYVTYNGLETIAIYQGTSLEDKVKVAEGKESSLDATSFTCEFTTTLEPGDYFIQARTDVFTVNGGKMTPSCYFKIDFTVPEGKTTGIQEMNNEENASQMFDLMGRRVNDAKGIRILNGKKVIIR